MTSPCLCPKKSDWSCKRTVLTQILQMMRVLLQLTMLRDIGTLLVVDLSFIKKNFAMTP